MMATAFDYTSAFGQQGGPFGSLSQGLQLGAQLAQADQQTALREAQTAKIQQELAANQAKAVQQQKLGEAYKSLVDKVRSDTWQPADFQGVALLAPKEQSEAAIKFFDTLSKDRQAQVLSSTTQVMAALGSKNPEIGVEQLNQRAEGFRKRGDEGQAKFLETQAKLAAIDPALVVATLGDTLIGLPGGKEAIESLAKRNEDRRAAMLFGPQLQKAQYDADKAREDAIKSGVDAQFAPAMAQAGLTKAQSDAIKAATDARFAEALNQAGLNEKNWNIRAAQNQINVASARLGLDQTKTAADVQLTLARIGEIATSLPEQAKKDINTAAVAAGTAKQQASQFNSLADRLAAEGGGFGVFSSATDYLRKATGNQGYMQELRQEFTRLRNSAAVQSLPPGPATDKDIALVLEGFPPSNADSRTMSSFLRGMAKIQDINSATENARVDWLANNRGSLGRASSVFPAGDFAAKPGETWVDMSTRIAQEINNRYAAGAGGAPAQPAAAIPGAPLRPGQVAPAGPRVGTPGSLGGAMPGVPAATTDIRSQADLIISGRR
jgi:hypothetical protein